MGAALLLISYYGGGPTLGGAFLAIGWLVFLGQIMFANIPVHLGGRMGREDVAFPTGPFLNWPNTIISFRRKLRPLCETHIVTNSA